MERIRPEKDSLTTKDKASPASLFAHLFPGNDYLVLPSFHLANIPRLAWQFEIHEVGFRNKRFIRAILENRELAEKEKIRHPDKLAMFLLVRNGTPCKANTFGGSLNGVSLADQLEDGETLGGVLQAQVSEYTFVTPLAKKMGGNPYFKTPLFIIGVVKEDKPSAVIYYIEGKNPRKKKK